MNIQIRSFVKGGNHGQYLQALGLKIVLEELLPDAQVTHLNYENHYWRELKIQIKGGMLPKFLAMRYFWGKNIKFSPQSDSFDITIYGSDMIWHLESKLFHIDKMLFGAEDYSKYKIAYAPSCGARGRNEPKWITALLDTFSAIGVRDKNTSDLVSDKTTQDAKLVIDPCFYLLESKYSNWLDGQDREDFISVYSPLHYKLVSAFHNTLEMESLPGFIAKTRYLGYFPRKRFFQELPKQFTDPLWTVQQIARSKLLITSTFHGVMMALMTKTPFIAITSPNLTARLDSPIANTFSKNRLMTFEEFNELGNSEMEFLLDNQDFDFDCLQNYIDESKGWLRSKLTDCLS